MKFGGDLLRTQFFQPYYNNNRGTYIFNGYWTSVPIADFELGVLNQVTQDRGYESELSVLEQLGILRAGRFPRVAVPHAECRPALRDSHAAARKVRTDVEFRAGTGEAGDRRAIRPFPICPSWWPTPGSPARWRWRKTSDFRSSLIFPSYKDFAPRVRLCLAAAGRNADCGPRRLRNFLREQPLESGPKRSGQCLSVHGGADVEQEHQ